MDYEWISLRFARFFVLIKAFGGHCPTLRASPRTARLEGAPTRTESAATCLVAAHVPAVAPPTPRYVEGAAIRGKGSPYPIFGGVQSDVIS